MQEADTHFKHASPVASYYLSNQLELAMCEHTPSLSRGSFPFFYLVKLSALLLLRTVNVIGLGCRFFWESVQWRHSPLEEVTI